MGVDEGAVAGLAGKFAEMLPLLDERVRRLYLGSEARARADAEGCSLAAAAAVVAVASGASRTTVMAGAGELAAGAEAMPGRSRRPGAGRPGAADAQPGLRQALLGLAEEATRGDPMAAITWCSQSLRDLAREMAALGFRCGKDAVARVLHEEGYSLQGMARVVEGSRHPDRDAQFRYVNEQIAAFRAAGDPAISVDAKKKELVGLFARPGRSWRPQGDPVKVRDHDFPDRELGKITPYGIYDIAANRGFASVGTSHDTGAFAVSALRLWWHAEGSLRYPGARRLLVTCDAGGSNGHRCRLWKDQLAELAAETGLEITVLHLPPGTSKWNKIEHRLFCHITRTWRARPLMTREDAVAGIAATVTAQGLKCTAVLDSASYPDGTEISDARMRYLEDRILQRHAARGKWNYTVLPAPRPAPEPEPEPAHPSPDPAMTAALAALAGIGDLAGLAAALPPQDARGQRPRPGATWLSPGAAIAATACHHALGVSYPLLGRLLGIGESTASQAGRQTTPILARHGITPRYPRARIRTLSQLTEHATAQGITIPPPKTPATTTRPKPPTK
jgi:hypothetical protein